MSLDRTIFEDMELEVIAEPMETSSGKFLKLRAANDTQDFQHNMPVERYDDKMVEIMAEMFYARNKSDLIGEANSHEQAVQTTMEVMRQMMEVVSDDFNSEKVRRIIERKRKQVQISESGAREK